MTAFRALLAYEELLRRFQNQLSAAPNGVEETFEFGLSPLVQRLGLRNVGLFWWDAQRNAFVMQYVLHDGLLMEGEEEIIIESQSPLQRLIDERRPVIVSARRPWIAFIPLQSGPDLIGAVRFERRGPMPRARVMQSLPPMLAQGRQRSREEPLLEDIADILSLHLHQLTRDEKHRKRAQFLQASTEVATAVFERPRLRDMLQAVGRSIVRNLGFDRIRFFLVEPNGGRIDGVLGLQIPGRLIDLSGETYPLRRGTNTLVDVVLAHDVDPTPQVHLVGGRVVYAPLVVNGGVVGCVAADNLLSQQIIDEEQMEALRVLAAQIGMAVANARLFEDIEQQAITDGLTKLYVHRYFQQRLKEELDRADRYSYSVAVIMMDIDNFKTMNDRHGHLFGDKALETLAQCIRANIRRIDLAARYGGDEIALVLPEIAEPEAMLMADRLQAAIRRCVLTTDDGQSVALGVTMGGAMYRADAGTGRALVESADRSLYWAKRNRRGSISFFSGLPSTEKAPK